MKELGCGPFSGITEQSRDREGDPWRAGELVQENSKVKYVEASKFGGRGCLD
jgi:hypothetical protein